VTAYVDKFMLGDKDTGLQKILKDKGITTLVPVGTTPHNGVLFTSVLAALRGFNVVVPVDGMAGITPTRIRLRLHLANSIVYKVTLTKHRYGQVSMIGQFVCCPVPTGLSFGKAAARRKSANAVFMAIAVLGRLADGMPAARRCARSHTPNAIDHSTQPGAKQVWRIGNDRLEMDLKRAGFPGCRLRVPAAPGRYRRRDWLAVPAPAQRARLADGPA